MARASIKRSAPRTGAAFAFNPDTIGMFRAVVLGVFVTFGAQVLISAHALYAVGLAGHLGPAEAWVVPVGIDVPILVFTGAALIFKRRGRGFQRFFSSILVGLMTVVSCALNYLHGLDTLDLGTRLGVAFLIVTSLSPLLIYANVEVMTALITREPPKPREPGTRRPAVKSKRPARKIPTPAPVVVEQPKTEGEVDFLKLVDRGK